jgi:hypothetical protein
VNVLKPNFEFFKRAPATVEDQGYGLFATQTAEAGQFLVTAAVPGAQCFHKDDQSHPRDAIHITTDEGYTLIVVTTGSQMHLCNHRFTFRPDGTPDTTSGPNARVEANGDVHTIEKIEVYDPVEVTIDYGFCYWWFYVKDAYAAWLKRQGTQGITWTGDYDEADEATQAKIRELLYIVFPNNSTGEDCSDGLIRTGIISMMDLQEKQAASQRRKQAMREARDRMQEAQARVQEG